MYEEFYGLKVKPFAKTPDPKFLFLSKGHEEALARLQYAVEEREIVVLTGDVGCGKTTLTRALIDSLDEKHRIVLVVNPRLTATQLLRTIARRFGIDEPPVYKDDLIDMIYKKVYEDYTLGTVPVLIIDEAHLIPDKDAFEEIRLLTNFQLDDTNLLCLILAGQTDLIRRLEHKSYFALKQRIGLFYHLGPVSGEEIKDYIEHRLNIGGRQETLFTDDAIKALYSYSGGVPRLINNLATAALLSGIETESDVINPNLVADAAKELGLNGYREN